jgi:DNA invertase Pin-like site-specific DNA recombinase
MPDSHHKEVIMPDAPIGIYVRVSRKGDREDERFHSPAEQAERARALAVAKGYVPGPVFEDIDVSGGTAPAERPAMGELLAGINRGELGGIAAYSLDRLSRDPAHGDALVKRVTKAGGVLLTPDMPEAIDSPTGEFTFGMLLQVAKLYRSTAGARFASSKERAIRAGIPVSTVPVGYRQKADRSLEPDPATAPAVRKVFERRAAGAGWTEIANILGEATGRKWSLPGARGVLANRLYATGRLEYGDIVADVEAGALVDEPLWHAAQRNSGPRPKRHPNSKWTLPGLARCAACGYALTIWTGAKRRRDSRGDWVDVPYEQRARRYRCRNRNCTEQANANANDLERLVALQTFSVGDELATRAEAPDLGALEDAVAVAERRLEQVLAPEARDALGDLWAADVKARRTERDAALTALGEARQDAGVLATEFRLRDVWDGLSTTDRRAALALFWKEIRVGRKAVPKSRGPLPVTFVARGPNREVEVDLPNGEGPA